MNKCTLCHEGTYRERLVVFSSRHGDRVVVVDDVPAFVCDMCGDQIIAEATAREIERVVATEPRDSAPLYRFPQKVA